MPIKLKGISILSAVFFIVGLGISTLLPFQKFGQAQVQNSGEMQPPKTKLPLGTKRGLDELKTLLDASEPTNSPAIRRVIITIPKDLPERFRLTQGGALAIAEFFLIADTKSLDLENFNPASQPSLQSAEGKKALLPNGGTIRLRVRKIKEDKNEKSIGEIHIKDHQIPGYEKVNQIEFFVEES